MMPGLPWSRGKTGVRAWVGPGVCVLLALMSWARPSEGQLGGSVLDAEGEPVVGATVELWRGRTQVGVARSAAGGRFEFREAVAREADAISAERIGYRPERRPLEPGEREVVLTLTAAPIPLQALRVEAAREFCRGGDDPEARALWEAARRRYDHGLDTLGIATYVRSLRDRVPPDGVGPPEGVALEDGQRGSSPILRLGWTRRIQREGYGYRVRRATASGTHDSWVYPPLEADLAPHLISSVFGELHRFQVVSRAPDGWTVAFCPRRSEGPSVEGTITFAPDTSLTEAEWLFRTPEPVEQAGGKAFFPDAMQGGHRHLLPQAGLFWRRLPGGQYLREYHEFERWIMAQGDSVPFLPARRTP